MVGLAATYSGSVEPGFRARPERPVPWRHTLAELAPTAWLRHQITRRTLARKGLPPKNVIGFLQSAHERGVLRQTGGHYRFRHALLQEHLVDRASADKPAILDS